MEKRPPKKFYSERINIGSDGISIGRKEIRFSETMGLSTYSDKWSPIVVFLAALTFSQIAIAILRRENQGILSLVFLVFFGLGAIVTVIYGIAAIRARPHKIVVIGRDRKPRHFSGLSKVDAKKIESAYAAATRERREVSAEGKGDEPEG